MKTLRFLLILTTFLSVSGCASTKTTTIKTKKNTLLPATSIKNGEIEKYKYIFVTPTDNLSSSSGYTLYGQYYSSSKSINPSSVISGILSKKGLIILSEIKPELIDETLIVNYGESGRRPVGLGGYTIEVTIQFISAKTTSLICSCTAEGFGATEVDDIREAISRCLVELIPIN
jgi:hypothetical protein